MVEEVVRRPLFAGSPSVDREGPSVKLNLSIDVLSVIKGNKEKFTDEALAFMANLAIEELRRRGVKY